jgi:predicted RNA-binding protein with EMAP domain
MNIIEKIEQQTEKFLDLRQEIESIVEALNDMPAWAQSIDEAKDRAKELQKVFYAYYEITNLLTDGELQKVINENEQVLSEMEEIKNYLSSWLEDEE